MPARDHEDCTVHVAGFENVVVEEGLKIKRQPIHPLNTGQSAKVDFESMTRRIANDASWRGNPFSASYFLGMAWMTMSTILLQAKGTAFPTIGETERKMAVPD